MTNKSDIILKKINNSFMKIVASESICNEISGTFTFMAPNAIHDRRYQNNWWDGKIRLFNMKDKTMHLGHIPTMLDWAEHENFTIEVDHELEKNKFSPKEALDFFNNLDLPPEIKQRPYQMVGFTHAIREKRCVLLSPTSSGKSLMIYLMIMWMLSFGSKKKGVLIVPTTSLVEQMYSDFAEYGLDVEKYCHRVHSQAEGTRHTKKPITITTWQSMTGQSKKFYEQFEFIIGDEAHHFQAKELRTIMESMVNAEYRIGTTGSLSDAIVHKLMLIGLFGPVKDLIKTYELIEQGYAAPIQVKALLIKHPEDVCNIRRKARWDYRAEINYIAQCDYRNKFVSKLACSLTGNTLVLFNLVDKHGKLLYDIISEMAGDDKGVFFISGDTPVEDRELIRKHVNATTGNIIIASYGTFSTGINIQALHNLVFAMGFKSRIRNLQSLGRILRLHESKDVATLFDIGDDFMLSGDQYDNPSLSHMKQRLKLYMSERFPVTTKRIKI